MATKKALKKGLKMPHLIPQPNGGALMSGGTPGNKGGGRTPNRVREEVRELLHEDGLAELRRRFDKKNIRKISHQDFARYIDTLGKYGIGTKHELSGPDDGPLSHGVLLIPGAAPMQEEDEEPSS